MERRKSHLQHPVINYQEVFFFDKKSVVINQFMVELVIYTKASHLIKRDDNILAVLESCGKLPCWHLIKQVSENFNEENEKY